MTTADARTPWHLWAVAILTLLWNGAGAATIVMAQTGSRLDMNPHEIAYYANQPLWFTLATDVATFAPLAGAVALLVRHRAAAWLFATSLAAVVFNNAYDVAAGTSLALADSGWRGLTLAVIVIALLQFVYAWTLKRRGVI
jgi:hypothetical protein